MAGPVTLDTMKVLLASTGYGLSGGISNLAGSTLRALDELASSGRLGGVATVSLHDVEPPHRTMSSARSTVAGSSRTRFVRQLMGLLWRDRPGLVLFDHVGLARSIQMVPRKIRPPVGVMVHGLELEAPVRRSSAPLLRSASLVLAVSERTAVRAVSLAGVDLGSRLQVLNPCVSRERIDLWSRTSAPPLGERRPYVLIAGRMELNQPGKGHEALIEGWPLVVSAIPGARLVVAGKGNKRSALERLAHEQRVGESVNFVGHVTPERLGELYRQSTVYAMPSRQEGFGIVFAEAMWHGMPCIGSTSDAASELIQDGETGLLVPYGDAGATADAVVRLLKNEKFATRMGETGRKRALARFSPGAFRERLLETIGMTVGTG